jgi:hypothetical protein
MRSLVTFGLGALAMYLLDPVQGARRRAQLQDGMAHAKRVFRAQRLGSRPVNTRLEPLSPA